MKNVYTTKSKINHFQSCSLLNSELLLLFFYCCWDWKGIEFGLDDENKNILQRVNCVCVGIESKRNEGIKMNTHWKTNHLCQKRSKNCGLGMRTWFDDKLIIHTHIYMSIDWLINLYDIKCGIGFFYDTQIFPIKEKKKLYQ